MNAGIFSIRCFGESSEVRGILKGVRYRLAFIRSGEETPAILYDNHHPKGHHRHVGQSEEPYDFRDAKILVADFLGDAIRAGAAGALL